jgi:diacylglycerol kinase (ATP)
MHAAALLGPGNVAKPLWAFQRAAHAEWTSLIEQADAIVIFGGDGTIHHHLRTLVELGVPVMVVPCGSGNDFARALGLQRPRDSLAAWQKFSSGGRNVRTIDLGLIQPLLGTESALVGSMNSQAHYFGCSAGVGLDAEIARRANALPRWIRAHGGYGVSVPRELFRFDPFPMRVSSNGGGPGQFRPTLLAAVANTSTYGGGMKIAPRALLDDGKLDLCIVRDMNPFTRFCLFPTVYFGRHLTSEKVEYQQTDRVSIETESPFDVYADGEYVCRTPVDVRIAREVLQVIVP